MTSTASLSKPSETSGFRSCIRVAEEDQEREAENEKRGRGNATQHMHDDDQDVVEHSVPPV